MPTNLTRQYVKACEIEDFDDPRVRATIREIAPTTAGEESELHRKKWEYAFLANYLEDQGALTEDAEVLAVAAGHEEPLYWLSNRVARVVATDIYGDGGFAVGEAAVDMLTSPQSFAPYPYREDRLEVRHMNALDLEFPDASFDIVYSLSSIEHFGSPANIRRAAREMSRVLRPGGHLIIVTECLIEPQFIDRPAVQFAIRLLSLNRRARGARLDKRAIDAFTAPELERDIASQVDADLAQPLDLSVSERTYENLMVWRNDGDLIPRTGKPYPHILLKGPGAPWTSVFLAFQKRGTSRPV